jgi:thiamine biosynthesis lipoprotein
MCATRLRATQFVRLRMAIWKVAFVCVAAMAGYGRSLISDVGAPLTKFTRVHPAMGTDFTLYIYCASAQDADTTAEAVFAEVDRIEELLSNYRDSSELSRINRNAAMEPVTTDPEMLGFLEQSAHWSSVSHGGFDITVGRLMKAWGFYRHNGRIPPPEELEHLRSATGWEKVVIDKQQRTVRFKAPGVELDPGGIGKGFAVDAVVRLLRAEHVRSAMISAGSSTVYALGAPPGLAGWRVVVPGPLPRQTTLSTVMLRDMSLSSADCSQKNFMIDGHLYCHIMDPRTMQPVEGRVQVTILSPSATASDALSNVLFVDKPRESAKILAAYASDSRALVVFGGPDRQSARRCMTFRWAWRVSGVHCEVSGLQGTGDSFN